MKRPAGMIHLLLREHVMGCCCNDKKTNKDQSPDCMASKSTVVTTPEGEDVEVQFNMGTGEVTYSPKKSCCSGESGKEETSGCCCSGNK